MRERANKTIMCSVLFLDIPNYSRMAVSGQIELKERFNAYLSSVISHVPQADRIILDTGDGAAINFLGDVEDALKVALALDEKLHTADPEIEPRLSLRMGINLGPVRLTQDINEQPNIVGDGINVAQRIMAFADIGQILVSRSYHDAVSRLSPEYAGMLHPLGTRTDKHVREHEVYALVSEGRAVPSRKPVKPAGVMQTIRHYWNALADTLDDYVDRIVDAFQRATPIRRATYASVILAPILLVLFILSKYGLHLGEGFWPWKPSSVFQAETEQESAAQDGTDQEGLAKSSKKAKGGKNSLKTDSQSGTAHIIAKCVPGSEIFVDGAPKGKIINTPLTVEVAAGIEHAIIITDPSGRIHSQSIKLSAGQVQHLNPGICK